MKFPQPIPVLVLAQRFHAQLIGDAALVATGINEIHKVEPGDIAFSDAPKYFQKTLDSAATVILLNAAAACPPGKAILVVENPFEAYDTLIREHRPFEPSTNPVSHRAQIHPTAIIEPGAIIAANVSIGAHSYIQANAYIGEYTIIGEQVQIGPNSTIGSDAFYFKKHPGGAFQKWRSGGRVIIEDRVDIGAGCTINKGVSGDTVIGAGSKLDCQIHIGHGVVIGKNCLMAAQVGIGGKTVIEDNVVLYGQVGVIQAVRIGQGAIVLAGSGVSKSLEGGKTYFGSPAEEMRVKYREIAALRQLPDLLKKWPE
ncbi:MAG: UDP-3-O-(3-hydroxymyristoyl)glucosamine N-acyltransferase [Saprospirales bacterium]|jgi:UDP-3-O-[3-hydroxymyristoyl] glucosamine N-acyltransferase|nr:UDP-3-O-(3-hydroxymyristoyl)glucosamine N-acyltransferase [Saprospirales bacterium]MBK8923958.1 UDP-3-O-(3-hydroxymyristoyl)glucosamine N-acyltransferase [Saprospirales bacterium]